MFCKSSPYRYQPMYSDLHPLHEILCTPVLYQFFPFVVKFFFLNILFLNNVFYMPHDNIHFMDHVEAKMLMVVETEIDDAQDALGTV